MGKDGSLNEFAGVTAVLLPTHSFIISLSCSVFCKNESTPNIISAILSCDDLGSSSAFEILVIS